MTLKAVYRKLETASSSQVPSTSSSGNVNTSVDMNSGRWILIGVLALIEMGLVIYLKNYVDETQPMRKEK